MGQNILVTGAAGYIGGSIVADFLASNNTLINKKEHIIAAVRSQEQASALSKLGIKVLQIDLTDEKAVLESLLRNKISIVIHTASSLDATPALHLITALSKQREISGKQTYFIHTSALSAFYERTGWPHGATKETGPVFELEKQLADSNPIRKTDVAVIEHAKARGVTSFTVVPSTVYGKGTGQWNQLSVVFPICVQSSISRKTVYKFPENVKVSGVHISDMTALYGRIVEKILQKETLSSGEEGYYFALAHDIFWWETLDSLAVCLHARGLLTETKVQIWPSDEAAAESLGVPALYVQAFFNSGEDIISESRTRLGWEPVWNKEMFLKHIDDDIQAVLDHGKVKSSLIESLFKSTSG